MTQNSNFWPTDGTGDGPAVGYTEQDLRQFYIRSFIFDTATMGPIRNVDGLNTLAVTDDLSPLQVDTGAAWVIGLEYHNDAPVGVTVATPGADQGGRIILRADWVAQTIRLFHLAGAGAGIPALTQTPGTTYEISLCSFVIDSAGLIWTDAGKTIRGVTDTRIFVQLSVDVGSENLIDDSVGTGAIAPAAVTDVELGARAIQVTDRQGGSSTDWTINGPTGFIPSEVREQIGVKQLIYVATNETFIDVTFPVAFFFPPSVVITCKRTSTEFIIANVQTVTTTGFRIRGRTYDDSNITFGVDVFWRAIGAIN